MSLAPQPSFWRRLSRLGVDPRASPLETRHVVVVNTLTLLAMVTTLVSAPIDLTHNFSWPLFALHTTVIVLYAAILALNHYRFSTLASILLMTAVLGGTEAGVLVQGPASGVHFGFLAEILCAFLVFHHRAAWLAFFFATIAGTLFFLTSVAALEVAPDEVLADGPMFRTTSAQVAVIVLIVGFIARRVATATQSHIRDEREAHRRILRSLYPQAVADSLAEGSVIPPRHHALVSVLSCDIVGFTPFTEARSPEETVRVLDTLFSAFDQRCLEIGVEKIATVGDGYIAAAGLWGAPDPASRAVALARAMIAVTEELAIEHGLPLRIRVGITTGPAVSGMIGRQKVTFDLWGDPVTRVRLLERAAAPGEILIDAETARLCGEASEMRAVESSEGSSVEARLLVD